MRVRHVKRRRRSLPEVKCNMSPKGIYAWVRKGIGEAGSLKITTSTSISIVTSARRVSLIRKICFCGFDNNRIRLKYDTYEEYDASGPI